MTLKLKLSHDTLPDLQLTFWLIKMKNLNQSGPFAASLTSLTLTAPWRLCICRANPQGGIKHHSRLFAHDMVAQRKQGSRSIHLFRREAFRNEMFGTIKDWLMTRAAPVYTNET